jgi:hypothetical protein
MKTSQWPFGKIVLGCIAGSLAVFYCYQLNLGPVEAGHFIIGSLALWVPLGGWLYLLLRNEVPDRTVRIAFSAGASYALTTLFYFAAATLHCNWVFYSAETIAGAGLIYYAIKNRQAFLPRARCFKRFDWVLATLIAASMVANISVQSVWRKDSKTGEMIYDGEQDHLYHVGQAYELSRHIPPRQAMIRGGTPERAYHNFMHLTTMLVDRYTGQPDMLHAHLFYHYTVIQILMCLLLYGIGKTLAASRVAGYCALALMYVAVAPAPDLWPVGSPNGHPFKTFPYFYFTVFPHLSSGLDPVALTSPQMYSGLVVIYTFLLGLLIILERTYRERHALVVTLLCALILGTTTRFRIHIALAMLPAFLLIAFHLWRKRHRCVFLLAGFGAVVLAGLLYLEMRSPVYLQGTSNVRLGYSGLSAGKSPLFRSWPFAPQIHDWLTRMIPQPEVTKWAWEVICLSMFSLLNVIGIPLLAATSLYLTSERARRVFAPFNFLIFSAIAISICLAIILASDYDSASVGGQLPFHTRWYLFPFAGVALWRIARFVQKRFSWPAPVWTSLASTILIAGLLYRTAGPASPLTRVIRESVSLPDFGVGAAINAEEWSAFVYLREQSPSDSVILTNRSWGAYAYRCVVSGLAGRAAYLEYPGNPVDRQAQRLNPRDNRTKVMAALRETTTDDEFCNLIWSTPITHLLEFEDHPWVLHPAACLTPIWKSPRRSVIIWQVIRPSHS